MLDKLPYLLCQKLWQEQSDHNNKYTGLGECITSTVYAFLFFAEYAAICLVKM
jgi:hypothetical protein